MTSTSTKTFRVDARLRNNLLIKMRESFGYKNPAEAARALGLPYPTIGEYEALSKSPWRANGEWKPSALAIATIYNTIPELLWPEEIAGVRKTRASMEIDTPVAFLDAPKTPEETLLEAGRSEVLTNAMELLTPRERKIIEKRFGLNGETESTLEKIGESFEVNRERIRQIEQRAFKKLRELVDKDGEPKKADLKQRVDLKRWLDGLTQDERSDYLSKQQERIEAERKARQEKLEQFRLTTELQEARKKLAAEKKARQG